MRPLLTVASSLTPELPWWRNVSMPAGMLERAVEMVVRNIAKAAPRSGVAITIRVPGQGISAEDMVPGWRWLLQTPREAREAEVVSL